MPLDTAPQVMNGQIVTADIALDTTSPYITVVNSSSPVTVTLPTNPTNWEIKAVSNGGSGIAKVMYPAYNGAGSKTIAQGNAIVFQYVPILGFWILK
jgi:hypothetical protein